jgi:hypothetical protein
MTQQYKEHRSFSLSLPLSILQRADGLAVAEKISRVHQGQILASNEQLSHLISSLSRKKSPDDTDP